MSELKTMLTPKPEFVTNTGERSVADALNGFIGHAAQGFVGGVQLNIATAYFNVGGYSLLADSLDLLNGTRLLLGAEPEPMQNRRRRLGVEPVRPDRAARARLNQALQEHQNELCDSRDLLGFSQSIDASTKRLVEWLKSGKVEVRRLEDRFLHGKAFLINDHSHGVIAGSSNFTRAGLQSNLELNLGNYTPSTVAQVSEWFNELWDSAAVYDLAELFAARFEPHSPYLIYLRMLWEFYGDELRAETDDNARSVAEIHLTSFQKDGVWRAKRILDERNGVLIADEVGLGKTFIAGELIREAVMERRQRVLVVTPATLRDGPWRAFKHQHNLPMELVSYEQLMADSRLKPDLSATRERDDTHHSITGDINDYAMVVVDEAHNLRNPATQRAQALRKLLSGAPPKLLVLLTATPVNNSLWDLYHQLCFFLRNDAAFADMNIASMRNHFAEAMRVNPDDLTPERLFDILDSVAVRRTRSFVKRYYPNDTVPINGKDTAITFPTPRVRKVSYNLDAVLPGFFNTVAHALNPDKRIEPDAQSAHGLDAPRNMGTPYHPETSCNPDAPRNRDTLTFARYTPSKYKLASRLNGTRTEAAHTEAAHVSDGSSHTDSTRTEAAHTDDSSDNSYESQFAGLLRSNMLKRFESSPHAFANTCESMVASHDAFLALLDRGWVATGDELADWVASDSDATDEVDSYNDHRIGLTDDTSTYDVQRLRKDVAADRELLRSLACTARFVKRSVDPNLAALVDELAVIAAEAAATGIGAQDTRNRRKVLVFSYFADTVEWIFKHLVEAAETDERLSAYQGRIAWLTGLSGSSDRYLSKEKVIWGFAPDTTDAPEGSDDDLYDIVVTTDVLAEGVNLQQARHIVNYDLPWNPMRLVQRHGRIDRIGSKHSEVFIRCVFPDSRLDELLNLEERLQRKIRQAAASVGVGEVLPEQQASEVTFSETREEIQRIRSQDATLFERGGTVYGTLSGEEYRQELRQAVESGMLEQIQSLPWGSGSGMRGAAGAPGYVFCATVGDRSRPEFRYVSTGSATMSTYTTAHTASAAHTDAPMSTYVTMNTDSDISGYSVVSETLKCLHLARPAQGHNTPRILTDDTYQRAFKAWEFACDDIVKKWNHLADKANLEPRIPAALARASEILRSHPPSNLTQDEIDTAIDSLNAPYPERTIRTVRAAMKGSDDPSEQAWRIIEVIRSLGMEPYHPPDPYPPITANDVHLVCWIAITC